MSRDSSSLHPDLRACHEAVEKARTQAKDLAEGLSEEQINWRPDDKTWSIGECLSHLVLSGGSFLPRIEAGIEEGRRAGKTGDGPYKHGFMGNMMVNMSGAEELPPKRRFKAPKFARPQQTVQKDEVVGGFLALQDRLDKAVHDADGLDLGKIKIASPMPLMKFTLGQWLQMMTGHQLRHLWQAGQVKKHASFPS